MGLRQERLIAPISSVKQAKTIQEIFDAQISGDFIFPEGENEGPLIIRRSCILEGNNSILWAKKGPVLIIEAQNVTVKNIRIEITEDFLSPEERIAIMTSSDDTELVDVEVFGSIKGFSGEDEICELPRIIELGNFASDKVNNVLLQLKAPSDSEIVNNLHNINIQPSKLLEGINIILFSLEPVEHNMVVYGSFFVNTLVKRRIYVTGKALNGAPEFHGVLPELEDEQQAIVQRGQRISLREIQDTEIKIEYTDSGKKRSFELDAYIFMLGENGKVSNDNDLIFWGNVGGNNALKLQKNDECLSVYLELAKIESRIKKISVCFSIYSEEPSENFLLSVEPVINIYSEGKLYYTFPLKDLCLEKTVEAVEFYRYSGEWKIKFIGLGWQKNLRDLCVSFGVDVE